MLSFTPAGRALLGKAGEATRAQRMLANEPAGVALLFNQAVPEIYIKDPTTPANIFLGPPSVKIATVRSTVGWYFDSRGLLKQAAINAPRYTYDFETLVAMGLFCEPTRTNVSLWNRDLTNVVWTKTNVTAALNQVGMDGVASSASSITATADAGTVQQAITLASSARFQTAYVKRLVGSGALEMTMDNGSTWTVVTPSGTGWRRVSIPSQTLANPTVGFRIGTSGDSFAIDLVQNEDGAFKTSPIITTTVAVNRAVDAHSIALSSLPFSTTLGTAYSFAYTEAPNSVQRTMFQFDNNTDETNKIVATLSTAGGGQLAITTSSSVVANILPPGAVIGAPNLSAGTWSVNHAQAALNGSLGIQDTSMGVPTGLTTLRFGTIRGGTPQSLGGTLAEFVYVPRTATDAELQSASLSGWNSTIPAIDILPNDANIFDSDYAATLTATSSAVSGVRPIAFGGYQYANPGWRRRFKTSARTVVRHLENLNLVGSSFNSKGAIYVDGVLTKYFTSLQAAGMSYVRLDFDTAVEREIELVMPYSASIADRGVSTFGVPITAPASRAGLPRAVFLGDSRPEEFNATSVDMGGPEMLCRIKNWQHVNLGYGSSGVTSAWGTDVGNANPDVVFIMFDFNNRTAQTSLASFKAILKALIANIRAIETTVKIFVVSSNPISAANDGLTLKMVDYAQQQFDAVNEITTAGDANIYYISGLTLIFDSSGDGIHPTDPNWALWATNIAPLVSV